RIELAPLLSAFEERRLSLSVRALPDAVATASSDASGSFSIAAPRPGMWTLLVRAPGAVPGRCDLIPLLAPVELPALRVTEHAGIEARVLDAQGRPVAGARVASWQARRERRREEGLSGQLMPAPVLGVTGADGRVRLARAAFEAQRWTASAPS